MRETWNRIWERTPLYWRRIRNWAAAATASIVAALEYSENMSPFVTDLLQHGLTACVVITLFSQLTSARR